MKTSGKWLFVTIELNTEITELKMKLDLEKRPSEGNCLQNWNNTILTSFLTLHVLCTFFHVFNIFFKKTCNLSSHLCGLIYPQTISARILSIHSDSHKDARHYSWFSTVNKTYSLPASKNLKGFPTPDSQAPRRRL